MELLDRLQTRFPEHYRHGNLLMIHGDKMDLRAELGEKEIELAIVDPPYGIGNFVQTTGNVRGNAVKWNDYTPTPEYFAELKRVSKEQIIWGANYYNSFNKKGGAIVWYKHTPPEMNFSECEIASYSRLKRVAFIDISWQNLNRREETIHPCQKPIALYEWLLTTYAKQGDKIFDTHLGSGSSRIAAYNLGFDFIGCEIDEDYFKAQEERFKAHTAQQSLFIGGNNERIRQDR